MIEFRLYPHPHEQTLGALDKSYMCSLENCRMLVLKKFLANRLKLVCYTFCTARLSVSLLAYRVYC